MLPYEIILKKRNGESLSREILKEFIQGFVEDRVPDYQMAAFLMAVYFRGMTEVETSTLTEVMVESGQTLHLDLDRITVDKHSTGGVGDKISFPLVPLLASCGLAVPMISGRGLGHTGGTLDKFESIPGLTTTLSREQFLRQVTETGMAIAGQTGQFVPADKKMYALRDVTATVDSIPLISASIMSKKIAEGVQNLVLDVKTGSGAFMASQAEAETLAGTMVSIGKSFGLNVKAIITDMNQPLGRAVGNALEINEAVEVLRGKGPADVRKVTIVIGSHLLVMAGLSPDMGQAEKLLAEKLSAGEALECFRTLVQAQGGDTSFLDRDGSVLAVGRYSRTLKSDRTGYVIAVNPKAIGLAATLLGGGRTKASDTIDPGVGIVMHAKPGDAVQEHSDLAELIYNDENRLDKALPYIASAFTIGEEPVRAPRLIIKVIE